MSAVVLTMPETEHGTFRMPLVSAILSTMAEKAASVAISTLRSTDVPPRPMETAVAENEAVV